MKQPVFLVVVICMALFIAGCSDRNSERSSLNAANIDEDLEELKTADDQTQINTEIETETVIPAEETTESEPEDIETVYDRCVQNVVCIYTTEGNNGTGFIYNEEFVITNAHVLSEQDTFTMADTEERELGGTIIMSDHASDIAIIRLDENLGKSVTFGDSDSLNVGEEAVFIGNPYSGESFSYCIGKRIDPGDELSERFNPESRYIAMDADIVSGYSGGLVFDRHGELIGISNATYIGDLSEYELDHVSLIIPINSVKEIIEKSIHDS